MSIQPTSTSLSLSVLELFHTNLLLSFSLPTAGRLRNLGKRRGGGVGLVKIAGTIGESHSLMLTIGTQVAVQ